MATIGRCRLCRNEAELQDSHFIPKAAYKRVRGEGKNPHPLVVQTDKAFQTADQIRAHLLCSDCEQRLSKNGEDTFFQYCYQGKEKFKLLEMLHELNPVVNNDQYAIYVLPKSDHRIIQQIGYLGVSVLWKSSAHVWKDRDHIVPSIKLGSLYQEQIRQFLLEKAPFPEYAALVIEVSDFSNRLISAIGTPGTSKPPTNHLHWIDLCGIRFNLFIGVRMPPQIKLLCVLASDQKCVLLAKKQEAMMARTYREHLSVLAGIRSSHP
jgi:hypothetical protein